MLFIDTKFVNSVSHLLRNFKQKKDYEWNFSCPYCGDSKTNTLKARGYVFRRKNDLYYHCHNCQISTTVGNLIKQLDPNIYNQYVMERYQAGASKYTHHAKLEIEDTTPKFVAQDELQDDILKGLRRIDTLPGTHPAKLYVKKRRIPEDKWKLLYFCPKWKTWLNSVKFTYPEIKDEHPRLVIPFFNEHGRVFALQGRAFGAEEPRYMTVKLDENVEKIFGLERVDFSRRVYAVEGPLDSLFLPNCIAIAGAGFNTPYIKGLQSNLTVVFDNEPRNKEITKSLSKVIDLGYNVCLWSDTIVEKDINDMVLAGKTPDEILNVINKNTFSGVEAKLRFATWRKCNES
jgi:transcription elongation factor Elf1